MLEVSARTGEGLDELRSVLSAAAARVGRRPAGGAVRLPIDRVFTMRGFGTVATGTLVSGTVRLGDELALLPGPLRAKVRGIQVHGQPEAEVTAGRRAAVNLGGVELTDVSRGQTLAAPETLAVTRRADVVIDLLPSARPLRHGARVRVHHGTAEVLGRVSIAGPDAGHIAAGDTALARLRLEAPAVLTRGDRVILRAYSPPITIGAATVLDPAPTSAAIRTPAALARLTELRPADSTQALVAMVRERGLRGLSTSDAVARAGLGPSAVREVLTALERAGTISVAGDRLVSGAAMDQAGTGLMAIVKAFHALQPLSEGLPREEARARLFGSVDGAVFEAVMRRLVAARAMVDRERLALPTHRAALPGGEATVAAVETAYREGGLTPPDMAGIATRAGVEAPTAEAASAYLMRQKVLVRLDALLLHRDALDAVKRDIAALKAAAGGEVVKLDVAQIKDRYGLSRKFAIPLLEYLDRERVTRRMGDQRVVL